MMNAGRRLGLLVLVTVALSQALLGWGNIGHMAVAYIAYQQLTPAVRDRTNQLLKLNPDYNKWLTMIPAGTSESDKPMMIFMIAATWPDQIRTEPQYSDDGTNGGDRPDGASSAQNIGYSDRLRHKYWHFVDTPFSQDGTKIPAIPSPNAESQIALFRTVLASNQPDELKSYDLVWLLHLVGDVHQPLHAATRVSAADPNGDNGGNNVKLCKSPCRNELHSFWDDLPGSGANPQTAVSYAKRVMPADAALASNTKVDVWVEESFSDAKEDVYTVPIGPGDGPFTLTSEYRATARHIAAQRIALAGARLANILNTELR